MNPVFVLIHSPLVGPFTWALTAEALRQRGVEVVVPTLVNDPTRSAPYWLQHAEAVRQAVRDVADDRAVLLVAHSGAGPLLPAVRQALPHPTGGYLFIDAGWPEDNKSRLDLFEDPSTAEEFRHSAVDGLLPVWSEEDLRPVIPDEGIRRRFASELRPTPLAVYAEALPVFPGWPDAPCGYLRFGNNPAYDRSSLLARRAGCPVRQMEGEHFHMLVDPEAVADALMALAREIGRTTQTGGTPAV